MTLRAADHRDLDAIVGLYDAVWSWLDACGHADQWGDTSPGDDEAFRERMSGWIVAGDVTVAQRGGRTVGVLACGEDRPPYVPLEQVDSEALYLYSVATVRDESGRGVAELLMARLEEYAEQRGASAITLDHWDRPELDRIYGGYGYVEVGRAEYGVLRSKDLSR